MVPEGQKRRLLAVELMKIPDTVITETDIRRRVDAPFITRLGPAPGVPCAFGVSSWGGSSGKGVD